MEENEKKTGVGHEGHELDITSFVSTRHVMFCQENCNWSLCQLNIHC